MKCCAAVLLGLFAAHFVVASSPDGAQPRLGTVFPVLQTASGIVLEESLWISPGVVVPKGAEVVNIFVMPNRADPDEQGKAAARNRFSQATADKRGLQESAVTEIDNLKTRASRSPVRDVARLRALLQVIDQRRDEAYLLYRLPGNRDVIDAAISPPNGALFAQAEDNAPRIIWVREGSLARSSGLRVGDRLIAVNGQKISSLPQADAAWRARSGERISFEVISAGVAKIVDFGPAINLMQSAIDAW